MITKEEVLSNLEQIKSYIAEAEQKKEEKIVGIAIKSIYGTVIFQSTKTTDKEAIIEKGDKNLSCADLSDANLYGADLSGAELNRALFYGKGGTKELKRSQLPDFLGALGFIIVD